MEKSISELLQSAAQGDRFVRRDGQIDTVSRAGSVVVYFSSGTPVWVDSGLAMANRESPEDIVAKAPDGTQQTG